MPIQLDKTLTFQETPDDPVEVYDTAFIVAWSVDLDTGDAMVRLRLGTTVSSVFTPGTREPDTFHLENRDAHIGPGGEKIPEDPVFDELEAAGFSDQAFCEALTKRNLCSGTVIP